MTPYMTRPRMLVDPYPPHGTVITEVRYSSALVLTRLITAVQTAQGRDALYIVGRDYTFDWQAPAVPGGAPVWRQIVVPQGFLTDLTSVPWYARWIVSRAGPWLEAAVVHDWLYVAWQDIPGRAATREDRRFADDLMKAAMQAAGVSRWRCWAIHAAVSAFGGPTYRKKDPAAEKYADLNDPAVRRQLSLILPDLPQRPGPSETTHSGQPVA